MADGRTVYVSQAGLDAAFTVSGTLNATARDAAIASDAITMIPGQSAAIQAAVESRLRSARLYDADAGPSFYVSVNVVGLAYSIELKYWKFVYDLASDETRLAPTWETDYTGTHGGDAAYIRSNLAGHVDRFLVAYLRVNESACD